MMINPAETYLHGQFVSLRPIRVEDAELTFQWRQSARATLLNRGAENVEQQARWIAARPATEFNFMIELGDGSSVGMLSLTGLDLVNSRAEPGRFLIGEEVAVRGVPAAAEAMLLLYGLAFDRLQLHRVHGMVAADNARMIKWQRYMGMTQEGVLRDHYFINGHYQDAIFFGLVDSEYRRLAAPRLRAMVAAARRSPPTNSQRSTNGNEH